MRGPAPGAVQPGSGAAAGGGGVLQSQRVPSPGGATPALTASVPDAVPLNAWTTVYLMFLLYIDSSSFSKCI